MSLGGFAIPARYEREPPDVCGRGADEPFPRGSRGLKERLPARGQLE